jgi:hypothetical protein
MINYHLPMQRIISLFIALFLICSSFTLSAQKYILTGTVIDKEDRRSVIGAHVKAIDLKDTTTSFSAITDENGRFRLDELKAKDYLVRIRSLSYAQTEKTIAIRDKVTDLGTIEISLDSKVINEVIVIGQGTAVQKGDTTIMKAEAFKVNPDASAEELVKKMPGITVENGTVKAHGEEIKKVLVDGKPFFGDDPSVALKNLPADVIDKIQVYNKLSDQSELTGFDDGSSAKTINIVTRKDARVSQFGKFSGGTNFSDKYLVAGNLNIFKGPRRFTLTGMSNNVNMQNFAMQDLVGGSGMHGGHGGSGGSGFHGSSGVSKNSSAGFNYTDNWGKKITATGGYFFNTTENILKQNTTTEYLFTDAAKYAKSYNTNLSDNSNHRFNLRIEYNIDTMNSIIIVPRLSLQENNNSNNMQYITAGGGVNATTFSTTKANASGYSFGNDITWRHKFLKKGRTLSVRSSVNKNSRTSDNMQLASTDSIPDNQSVDGATSGISVNTNLSYTEPLGKYSLIQANYNNNFNRNSTDKESYRVGDELEILGRIDSLSNVYDNDYITNRGGLSYLFNKNNLRLSTGIDYQRADLTGEQLFPQEISMNKTFASFLPNMMITYKFSELTNIRFSYRTSTNAPTVNQLQNVIDNSNRLSLSSGNSDLRQEYSHNIMTNLAYANPTSGFNAFLFLTGGLTSNVIASKTYYAKGNNLYLPEFNVTLVPGGQLTYPVNLDRAMNIRAIVNLAYFIKPLKSNFNFVVGGSYSQSPGYIDTLLNRSNAYNLTNSLILTSNISSNLDFTLSYSSNYSLVKNSANVENMNDKYWYQSASGNLNWIFWKGFTLNSDFVYQNNQGLSRSYNQHYFVWNASLGKKFLKNQAAEFRIGVYDILNQNNNISRTVTASSITDTRTNAFQRYFLVLLKYTLKSKNGQQPAQQQDQHQHEHRDGFPNMPPGSMPPGGMPPGSRPGNDYHRD